MKPPARSHTLIIGFGNDLRGDDAIGPVVAERIEAMQLPDVEVLRCHQLTPELAESIATAKQVIFVDAEVTVEGTDPQPRVTELHPAPGTTGLGHASQPTELLEVARVLYDNCPEAWLIAVPATGFELGAPLSAGALYGIDATVDIIRDLPLQNLVQQPTITPCTRPA